jgi:hypothetical protein
MLLRNKHQHHCRFHHLNQLKQIQLKLKFSHQIHCLKLLEMLKLQEMITLVDLESSFTFTLIKRTKRSNLQKSTIIYSKNLDWLKVNFNLFHYLVSGVERNYHIFY